MCKTAVFTGIKDSPVLHPPAQEIDEMHIVTKKTPIFMRMKLLISPSRIFSSS